MGNVIDIQNVSHRQKLDGWWIISVNVTDCENKVEYRENNGVMVHAKSFRDLPALVEQGRKLLARERAVAIHDGRKGGNGTNYGGVNSSYTGGIAVRSVPVRSKYLDGIPE